MKSNHHPAVCLTTGSKPLPKRSLHILRSTVSSFKWQYPLLSLRSSSSFLRLLPCLLVASISPFIFPSVTCFRRQFLRKMWPIHLAFRFLIACRIFLAHWLEATLLHFSHNRSNWSSPSFYSTTFQNFLIYCPKRPSFSTIQNYAPNVAFYPEYCNINKFLPSTAGLS